MRRFLDRVVMPLRALGRFGPLGSGGSDETCQSQSRNALAGIGEIRTRPADVVFAVQDALGRNALAGIGEIRTVSFGSPAPSWQRRSRNALAGIGEIRTKFYNHDILGLSYFTCRNALAGIGEIRTKFYGYSGRVLPGRGLGRNALAGIGEIRTLELAADPAATWFRRNALAGIGEIRTAICSQEHR